jgi:hypothetical protein
MTHPPPLQYFCNRFLNGTSPPPFPVNTVRFENASSSSNHNVTTLSSLQQLRQRLQANLSLTQRPCKFNRWIGEACPWYVGWDGAMKAFAHSKVYWDDELRELPIHVVNPCFTTHSMGNDFGMYAESLLCAKLSGAHLVAPVFVDPTAAAAISEASPFYRAIPKVLMNDARRRNASATVEAMADICRTDAYPWEESNALLHTPTGTQFYIDLFVAAAEDVLLALPQRGVVWKRSVMVYTPQGLEVRRFRRPQTASNSRKVMGDVNGTDLAVAGSGGGGGSNASLNDTVALNSTNSSTSANNSSISSNSTTADSHDTSSTQSAHDSDSNSNSNSNSNSTHSSPLPFIPDVAIHYRCGDNTMISGLLPFTAVERILTKVLESSNVTVRTVYIMAEVSSPGRPSIAPRVNTSYTFPVPVLVT